MNKARYRIIFNKARQVFMAVAENVKSQTKTSGQSQGHVSASESTQPFHQLWQVKCLVASISLWMTLAPAYAQIQADPTASAANRPVVGVGQNAQGQNVPVVNIQTPKNGVSHNIYKQMDVLAEGAVLNNSRTGASSNLVGTVGANPFLAKGEARIILNEVNSSIASRLEGNLEIAGQRADLIIANPAGINIKGSGFINVNKAILTTGKPQLNADGSIQQFVIDQGKITVSANPGTYMGLGSNKADYVDLYARALELNAQIHANKDIQVITGVNTISADLQEIAVKNSTGILPNLAIDIKDLGGMYASSIYLIGTEKGLGVKSAGRIAATYNIVVSSTGKIENTGKIEAGALVNIQTTEAGENGNINTSGAINSNGVLNIAAANNLDIMGDEILVRKGAAASLLLSAQGDINLSNAAHVRSFAPNTDVYLNAKNINLEKRTFVSGLASVNLNAEENINTNGSLASFKDLNVIAKYKLDITGGTLNASSNNIYLQTTAKESDQSSLTLQGVTLNSEGDLNLSSNGNINLSNLRFPPLNGSTKLQDIYAYSGGNLFWTIPGGGMSQISGKVQLEAAGTIDLQGKPISAKDNIQLQADHLQIGTELVSEKGIDLVSKVGDLGLYQALTAQNNININSLAGGISTNNLRAVSKSGKIALLAHRDINVSSGQTSTAIPSASLDELTTSKSSLTADQGIIIGSVGEGKVTVKATDLNAENGTIQLSGQNDIAVDGNTDVKVNGDKGQHVPVNSIFNAKSILIKNKKGNINIKDAQLNSTADQLYINSEMGKATIDHTQLKSKGNTEIFAKDILTLKSVTADSDQHLAVNTKRTLYLNADYTPATVWDPLAKTALTAKGILSLTAEGNQVMQNATLTGGAFLLETGNLYVKPGLIFNATGSELLKNDAQLNSLNGDLSIHTSGGNGLIIDPKIMNLSATGDIELIAKKGVLKLAGYGGTQGNGSEQVVKLDTRDGGINLEGASVVLEGTNLKAKKDINIYSIVKDISIEGVKNKFDNKYFYNILAEVENNLKNYEISYQNFKETSSYLKYKTELENTQQKVNNYEKLINDLLIAQVHYSYIKKAKAELENSKIELDNLINKYKDIIDSENNILNNIASKKSDKDFYLEYLNGYSHKGSNISTETGDIKIISSKGVSISGSNISAKTSNVEIEAQGALPDLYTSATTIGVNGQSTQLGASIIIDGHIDFYDRGNENDANYSMRTLLSPTIIDGNKGVNIRATGNTVQDNLILQATGITSVNGDIKIEANKSILFDAAIEQSYDRSTKTEKKRSWGGLKKKTITTVTENNNAGAASVDISGKNIFIESKEKDNTNNIDIYSGSLIANGGQVSIKSGGNINLYTVEESSSSNVDITKKSSFAGIKYNKSNTNATRTQVTELPGILKADYMGIKAENDVRLEGTEFEYLQGATIEAGRDLSLITASNMITNIIKKQKNSVVWQSMQDKGSITETARLPSFNGPVPVFKAGGGLVIQVPVSERNANINKKELTEAILALSKEPGNAYLKTLVERKDIDWQKYILTEKEWDYKSQGLTAAGAAILALVVAAVTAGVGGASALGTTITAAEGATTVTIGSTTVAVGVGGSATVFGSTLIATTAASGATTYTAIGAMINTALTSLATQSAIGLANNGGDIGKTLKELGSRDSIQNLATSIVTAGLLNQVSTALNLKPDSTYFSDRLMNNFTSSIGSTLVQTAINGGNLQNNLEKALLAGLAGVLQGELASQIGTSLDKADPSILEYVLHKVAHAAAGCATAAITKESCEAGAIGAGVGEIVAGLMIPEGKTALDLTDGERTRIKDTTKIIAGTTAAFAGYDVNSAANSANIAVENNILKPLSTAGKAAWKTAKAIKKELDAGKKITANDLPELLKDVVKGEIQNAGDNIKTLLDPNTTAFEKSLAILDLAIGVDLKAGKNVDILKVDQKVISKNSSNSVVDALKLKTELTFRQAGILTNEGKLTQKGINESTRIDLADGVIRNPKIVEVLTKDGSNIADWKKFTTKSVSNPNGQNLQIHFYKNIKTGKIDYETQDYKVKGIVRP